MPDPRPVIVPIQVRWRDLDALGHINNAVYLSYFEVARMAYLQVLLPQDAELDPQTSLPRDFQFILADLQITYRAPAQLNDSLQASVHVSQVGQKSFIFDFQIQETRSGRLIAEGRSTQVCYDYAARQSIPLPEEVKARMEALQGAPISRKP